MYNLTSCVRVIWETVLDDSNEGDFFSLGGDSIKLLFLVGAIEEFFGTQIDLELVFDDFTVEQLTAQLCLSDLRVEADQLASSVSRFINDGEIQL